MDCLYFTLLCVALALMQAQYMAEGTTNIALGKTVTMSSIYPGSSPGYATDGEQSGLWEDGCASTNHEANPWMIVDLGAVYSISSIVIYNRVDCCLLRLHNVNIEFGDNTGSYTHMLMHIPVIGASHTFPFSPVAGQYPSARYVKIWLLATEYLTICELEVYNTEGLVVDGGWSEWSEASECTRPCGTGTATRSRTCTNPPPGEDGADCIGEDTECVECNTKPCPIDCQDHLIRGSKTNGVYTIYPSEQVDGFDVYCDMTTDGGGWTVFQRREDGSVEFFNDWSDYQCGFGPLDGEHWLGNDKIHDIVSQAQYMLRVDLEDFEGETRYAKYGAFHVGPWTQNYILTVGGCFSGDAGDSMGYHSGYEFSTKDQGPAQACANSYKGGHWYGSCHRANLNGLYLSGVHASYADGVEWKTWKGYYYSLKTSEMKVKRK